MGVRKDRFPDKNLDCRTPTASDWKTNRTRSPVGTANTLMHQHYNDLQSSSSGLTVWVIFFAKDPRVTPSIIRTASVSFNEPGAHRKHARILRTRWLSRHIYCPPDHQKSGALPLSLYLASCKQPKWWAGLAWSKPVLLKRRVSQTLQKLISPLSLFVYACKAIWC